ncbi:MAG TPA: phage shock protein PspA [Gammaproteobacteria bacterium]|nr:phage shock protein PspA [Gammaproteobacteria bacterium]HET7586820.1 phage shock protein PspA [Gammaproteobacteria bacterium]
MGVFSRMSDIINSNINAMLDKAEDPEKVVRLIIQEMEDTLVEVRSAAARAIADRKELERRVGMAARECDEWQRKAELAVNKGRDDLAKAALAERKRVGAALDVLKEQHKEVELGLEKLNDDIAALQAKLADAKTRQKSLEMRHNTAAHRLQVRSRIHDERINDALGRFEYYERKMEHMEGKVEAYDLGQKRGLDQQFADLETDEHVEEELAALKQRLGEKKAAVKE